ncbi:MAG: TfuA-like protein [Allosphingosinicella sp.]
MTGPPIVIFAGPSVPRSSRIVDSRLAWRPPASAGDLLRLLDHPPQIICLIDGFFDARPAVWHKEILLLMQAGAVVLGAASMGALRAAELDSFGMLGVGRIYRAYRAGQISGDDEVALIHASEDADWKPLTEPMVDVRATLLLAVRRKILSAETARHVRAAARSIHFADRTWPGILARSPAHVPSGFLAWTRAHAIGLKAEDARQCLAAALATTFSRPIGARQEVPLTCFMTQLATECGVGPRETQSGTR